MQLTEAHVLVTGASRGLGALVAARAADRGAVVTLVARSADELARRAERQGGHALPADLSVAQQRRDLVARAEALCGRPVDVLVNAAGVDATAPVLQVDAEILARALTVNLLAPAELCRQAVPGMVARGRGSIVNLSSVAGTVVVPGLASYCASKAGLSHFTAVLRTELAGSGVGTTLVEVGPAPTELYGDITDHPVAGPSMRRFVNWGTVTESDPDQIARRIVAGIEADREHVVLPRRILPLLACTWFPRRAAQLFLSGLPKR